MKKLKQMLKELHHWNHVKHLGHKMNLHSRNQGRKRKSLRKQVIGYLVIAGYDIFDFCLTSLLFWRSSRSLKVSRRRKTFVNVGARIFTGQLPFLSPNLQCQNTEGISLLMDINHFVNLVYVYMVCTVAHNDYVLVHIFN